MPLPPRASVVLVLLSAVGCGGKTAPPAEAADPPRLVRTAPAELRMVQRQIRAHGFLESEHQNLMTSLVGGRIVSLTADEGSRVAKDDVLARLDDRQALATLAQLDGQLAARRVDKDLAALEVEAGGRRVAQARFEAQKAKAEFDRQAQMDPEYVSPKAKEDAELGWQAADQALQVASFLERKSHLEVTRIGTVIQELEARRAELLVQLDHHAIKAPFAGIVTRRHVTAGAVIGLGTTLFEIVDPERIVVYFDLPQVELDAVRGAREITFRTEALPGRSFTAAVDLVSPVISRETGHFRLRCRIRDCDTRTLVHGMFVRADVLAEQPRQALMVPVAARRSDGDLVTVMVVRGTKAHRLALDPGLEVLGFVECRNTGESGLRPGDPVIVEGHDDLADQADVRLAPAVPSGPAPAEAAADRDSPKGPAEAKR